MLARNDDKNEKLRLHRHKAIARTVTLLDGRWLHEVECQCGHTASGAGTENEQDSTYHAVAEKLPCWAENTRVLSQEPQTPRRMGKMLLRNGNPRMMQRPYGRVTLRQEASAGDVAVDASYRKDSGMLGVAAVSGAGWVRLGRLPDAEDQTSGNAEFMAIIAGLELMPPGNRGILHSDHQGWVEWFDKARADNFKNLYGKHISLDALDRVRSLLADRSMKIRWAPRNSTEMLRAADKLAGMCSQPEFDHHALSAALVWQRGRSPWEQNVNLIQGIEYFYCDSAGKTLFYDRPLDLA
jgi:ribonuclease HI